MCRLKRNITIAMLMLISLSTMSSVKKTENRLFTYEHRVKIVITSLSQLQSHDKKIPIDECLLANQKIKHMPDFSNYTIKKLDLSNNLIAEEVNTLYLPKGLEFLNISNNQIKGVLTLIPKFQSFIKEIDCSHNNIEYISIPIYCERLDASHNSLRKITFLSSPGRKFGCWYLDISYNWDFIHQVCFDPKKIKVLKREKCAHDKKLEKVICA